MAMRVMFLRNFKSKNTLVIFVLMHLYLNRFVVLVIFVLTKKIATYRGSPTYTKITNTVPTTMVLGLCTCKWLIFALVGDPLQSH